jgi:hypothetical protein
LKKLIKYVTVVRIGSGVGILGAYYVSSGDSMMANIVWAISNPILIAYNLYKKEYEQAFMFTVFWVLSIRGVINLW